MQNRYHSCDEAGYVVLSGGWNCPRCGCANNGCDVCHGCGWNRAGCQGGVVRTQTQSTRAACPCETASSRSKACDDCPASFPTGHSVQCCPDNTRIRRDSDCGCTGGAAYQTRASKSDCGCTGEAAYQTRASKSDCGCTGEAAYQTRASKSDCGCTGEAAYQTRASKSDCGEAAYQTRTVNSDCGCGDEGQTRKRNARVGIVHAVKQELTDVFESESALRTGTLFPELHKPLNGRCPACSNCSTCDQQAAFAAWDLRLYLNTHPNDREALALFRRLRAEADEPSYATTFLEDGCDAGWTWTEGPWPWECRPCGE